MAEPAWGAFAGVATLVTVALVGLARLSARAVTGEGADRAGVDAPADSADGPSSPPTDGSDDPSAAGRPAADGATDGHAAGRVAGESARVDAGADDAVPDDGPVGAAGAMSPGALLANVALSQGLFGSLLVVGAWYAEIPLAALGLDPGAVTAAAAGVGAALGVALYLGDELLAAAASHAGVDYSEALRELLAPASATGWVVLLGVALPVIAAFEELLFRGVLVGALAAGFDLPAWPLAVGSSLLFGFAHGAQGRVGVAVTGLLGFALAAAFVLTGSLLVVVVAHYLVNALEFAVHEGLDVEWSGR